jgi:hypothetical protein
MSLSRWRLREFDGQRFSQYGAATDNYHAPQSAQEKAKPSADSTTIAVKINGSAKNRQLLRNVSSIMQRLSNFLKGAHPDSEFKQTAIRAWPRTDYRKAGSEAPMLDRLKVNRAGLPFTGLAHVVAEALPDSRSNILVPLDRSRFEAEIVATGFLLDLAVALDRVE